MDEPWFDALRLHLTPGLGQRRCKTLRHGLGCADDEPLTQLPDSVLRDALGLRLWTALRTTPPDWADAVARVVHWLGAATPGQRHEVLYWGHPHYPKALLELPDPPLLLFVHDSMPDTDWVWPDAVALVGSRGATPQGLSLARSWACVLADAGWCVVSGLAMGIDAAAHWGALQAKRPDCPTDCLTIGVMGTGPDGVYPVANGELKSRIIARGRCVTEHLPGTAARPAHFPMRNRLLAALSSGLVVIEAGVGSGSLISAQCALDLGKEVMAVPGSVRSPQSRGCHALLRQGATLVEGPDDILAALPRYLGASHAATTLSTNAAPDPPTGPGRTDCTELLLALGHDPLPVDELQARMACEMSRLRAQLQLLEIEGLVAHLPGDRVQRVEL